MTTCEMVYKASTYFTRSTLMIMMMMMMVDEVRNFGAITLNILTEQKTISSALIEFRSSKFAVLILIESQVI